jgi:polysaccharide export outer membrane protein
MAKTFARPARRATSVGRPLLVLACALSLTGCGASLGGETASGLTQEPTRTERPNLQRDPASGTAQLVSAASTMTTASTPGSTGYKVGPLDVLEVSVFKVPELSRSVQVAGRGSINLPLVGEVPAAGRTAQEIERDLTEKLGAKYLQSPQVTVYVKEYNSQRVTIEGAVKKPGVYPIRGNTSLLQFIATAEGLDPASDSTVVVFRQTGAKRSAARFDISAIRSGEAEDPAIQPGDVIVVNTSEIKAAFQNVIKALPAAGVFMPLL